jgi:hypothetical protein
MEFRICICRGLSRGRQVSNAQQRDNMTFDVKLHFTSYEQPWSPKRVQKVAMLSRATTKVKAAPDSLNIGCEL